MLSQLTDTQLLFAGLILSAVQCVAALPWFWAVDPRGFSKSLRQPRFYLVALLVVLGLAALLAVFMGNFGESENLVAYGRGFGSILHLQLLVGFFILAPRLLVILLPKTGAVALAAYRESLRQPLFWLITGGAALLLLFSVFVPYYTFGDDYKMMKMIGFDIVMLSAALFGVVTASLSISEEIEGRTAITVMSKPINRRAFFIGKYLGILLACFSLALLLAWVLNWTLLLNSEQDRLTTVVDPLTTQAKENIRPGLHAAFPQPQARLFADGITHWFGDTLGHFPGVALGFSQAMILVAIAAALATRLAFVVNILVTLTIFFLGTLAPVVVKSTERDSDGSTATGLIRFLGQMFDTLLPALEHFQMNTAVVRELPLDLWQFTAYVATVLGYACIYTIVVLLVGLLLFENRDLA